MVWVVQDRTYPLMKLPWIDAIGTEYGSLSLANMVLAITLVNLSCTATIALSRSRLIGG
jgi:hypothetical protein